MFMGFVFKQKLSKNYRLLFLLAVAEPCDPASFQQW